MKKLIFTIFLCIFFLSTIPLIPAITTFNIKTLENHNIYITVKDTNGSTLIDPQLFRTDPFGLLEAEIEISEPIFDIIIKIEENGQGLHYEKFTDLKKDTIINLTVTPEGRTLPGNPPQNNNPTVPQITETGNEPTNENENPTNNMTQNQTNTSFEIIPETQNSQKSLKIITQQKNILYGMIILIIIILSLSILFVRRSKKKKKEKDLGQIEEKSSNTEKPTRKINPKTGEIILISSSNQQRNPELERARLELKKAQEKLEEIENQEKIKELKQKIIENEKEIMRLRNKQKEDNEKKDISI